MKSFLKESRIDAHPDILDTKAKIKPQPDETFVTENVGKLIIVGVLIVAVAVVLGFLYVRGPAKILPPREPSIDDLRIRVEALKQKFPSQDGQVWKRLVAATSRQFTTDTVTMPSVSVIVSREGGEKTVGCLSREFAKTVSDVFAASPPLIVPARLVNRRKLELDETLIKSFKDGVKVAVFPHLEQFDKDTLLLMHSYCDDQDANYKNVILLFEAHVPARVQDHQIETFIESTWEREVDGDEAGALVSRVLRNVVVIKAESTETLRSHNCDG